MRPTVGVAAVTATQDDPVEQAAPAVQERQRGAARASKPARKPVAQASVAASSGYTHYVEFRSRHALSYGHTFLMHGKLGAGGDLYTKEVVGLHPTGDDATWWTIGHLVWVPSETGPSDGDTEEEYVSARYRINLTAAQYARVLAFIRQKQKNSPLWHAVLYNCNAFVGDIAAYMGLKSPPSLEYPADFINGMRRMNGGVSAVSRLGGQGEADQGSDAGR